MPVLSSISAEIDEYGFKTSEKFVTDRGYELSVRPTAMGLYEIIPHGGGKSPVVCNSLYTSHLKAREALIAYIEETDRLGYAIHPDKPESRMRKTKVKTDAERSNTEALPDVREGSDN